jgi:hypothetical protein
MLDEKTVFLSSTCYDLADIRSSIESTLRRMGYLPILSDRTEFVVDPKVHRHDVCIAQAKLADLMILLIDRRFGADYRDQSDISVTWAEFRAARDSGIPIIALVRKRTWDEREKARLDPSFRPDYADPRLFKFLTELQDVFFGTWMQMFETEADIVQRLKHIGTLFGGPWIFREPGKASKENGHIVVSSISPEAQHLVYLLFGEDKANLQESDLMECVNSIPDSTVREWGREQAFRLHGFSVLVERVGREGEIIIRPTSLGRSLREEFEMMLAANF